MSAFVSTGSTTDFTLTNDGWFPDIDATAARSALRLDGSVTDIRLETALVNAMLSVNQDLAEFKTDHEDHQSLESIPASQINKTSRLAILYKRAVICIAGAEIAERYRSYDTSASGDKNAEALTDSADELRRDARWAIRDLIGRVRTTVEMI